MVENERSSSDGEIIPILAKNLSKESMWMLVALTKAKDELNKEKLKDVANQSYTEFLTKKDPNAEVEDIIKSKYSRDIHSARLESAGLVNVRVVGRIRFYSISKLGELIFEYKKGR